MQVKNAMIAGTLLITGCGTASPEPTVTATVTAPAPLPSEVPSTAAPTSKAPTKAAAARKVRIPNVAGKNHQAAQDTLQAAGFYLLTEEDATGQGRMLIWDRNWMVVRQSPKGGALADPETTRITLYSKKIGE
jgi:PASTA domain-containing protein